MFLSIQFRLEVFFFRQNTFQVFINLLLKKTQYKCKVFFLPLSNIIIWTLTYGISYFQFLVLGIQLFLQDINHLCPS